MSTAKSRMILWFWAAALGLSVGAGCAQPQRPFLFTTTEMAREPMDALVASANQLGLKPAVVDPRAGLLQSRWEDTRRRAAPIKERDAVVVRRFVIHLEHGSFGNDVTLNIEARRCVLLAFTLTETDVTGTCEPMTRLDQPLLKELAAVGSRLQQLMSIP